ncbi:hypothetical protein BLSTO_00418 [Blastocystis sp. subtype 1]
MDDYELGELLGIGGFGEVYKAFDKGSGVYVAVKKTRLQKSDEELQSESKLLMGCNSPFIVRYNGAIRNGNELWIIMEFCHCGSLAACIRSGNHFIEDELREIASCCLFGLYYLHQHNIIHRDIKPDNLFLSESGVIKLGDFGLAVQLEHSCSKRNTQCGTSWYMAPEVYDEKTELKSDVWSLGITLIELAEGKNPFAGLSSVAVMKAILMSESPSLSFSKWSAAFVDFVNKCLMKDVKERWSVRQLMNHSFVKDSVERIRSAGNSDLLVSLVKRVGKGRSVTVDNPSEVNMVPDTVIGGKPLIEPENMTCKVIVENDDDFLLLDENVEVIEVKNGMCNNEAFDEWSMEEYVRLKELIVGDECFQFVKDLKIVGLNALEKVEIGKQCFCKASDGVFEMRNCAKLKSVRIGDGSFVSVVSVVFENLPSLRTISLGQYVFGGELKLVMKNLGEFSELTGTMCALMNVKEVELMGMPKLKKCVLMGGLKNVKSVRMENAGKFESVKGLKEVVEEERKRREEEERRKREEAERKRREEEKKRNRREEEKKKEEAERKKKEEEGRKRREEEERRKREEERKKRGEMIAMVGATVNVRNVGDLKNASCFVGVIAISSYCCNDSELSVLDLSRFVNLRELIVGNTCFENVKEVKLIGLNQLERVLIGKNCFTKCKNDGGYDPDRHFYLKNCERMRELRIECYSFSDYSVCEIENVPSLEGVIMGEMNEGSCNFSYASLELKNLPSLKSLLFGKSAFKDCSRVAFENLPELTTILLGDNAFRFNANDESSELIMRNLPKLKSLTPQSGGMFGGLFCDYLRGFNYTFCYPRSITLEDIPSLTYVTLEKECAFKYKETARTKSPSPSSPSFLDITYALQQYLSFPLSFTSNSLQLLFSSTRNTAFLHHA